MQMHERQSLPQALQAFIGSAPMKDVSGWSGDKTWYIDRTPGAFLKIAPKGKLQDSARLQAWWGEKGLSARVLMYLSEDSDYLLTSPVAGKDCICEEALAHPEETSRALGRAFRQLHSVDFAGCPVNHLEKNLLLARTRAFQQWFLDDLRPYIGETSAETAAGEIAENAGLLKTDALVHGDACLPNVMLENGNLTGFIDIGEGGAGDHHYDLAWTLWSIQFNFKKPEYGDIFLDAYGRDAIDPARLRLCALLASME